MLVTDFRYRVYFNYFGFILTPLFVMAAIYIYIFTVVKAQIKEIASLLVSDMSTISLHANSDLTSGKAYSLHPAV